MSGPAAFVEDAGAAFAGALFAAAVAVVSLGIAGGV